MNQKGFANIILVVVIVILVGAVGYFAFVKKSEPIAQQPTPKDETANWKTYSNTSVGFELKYPTNWDLSVKSATNAELTPPANRLKEQPANESGVVSIVVESNTDKLDLQSWLTNSTKYFSQSEADEMRRGLESGKIEIGIGYNQKEITVGSKQGLDQYVNGEGGSVRNVFIPINDKIIIISLASDFHFTGPSGVDSRIKNLVDTFDKILLTFKFTK